MQSKINAWQGSYIYYDFWTIDLISSLYAHNKPRYLKANANSFQYPTAEFKDLNNARIEINYDVHDIIKRLEDSKSLYL